MRLSKYPIRESENRAFTRQVPGAGGLPLQTCRMPETWDFRKRPSVLQVLGQDIRGG